MKKNIDYQKIIKENFIGIEPEWLDDGVLDLAVEFDIHLFEEFGYQITYNNDKKSATIKINNEDFTFSIEEYYDSYFCWLWAVTLKDTNSRCKVLHNYDYALTDSDTTNSFGFHWKLTRELKKFLYDPLNKVYLNEVQQLKEM